MNAYGNTKLASNEHLEPSFDRRHQAVIYVVVSGKNDIYAGYQQLKSPRDSNVDHFRERIQDQLASYREFKL